MQFYECICAHSCTSTCALVQNKIKQNKTKHSLSLLMDATLCLIPVLLQAFSHIPNCAVFVPCGWLLSLCPLSFLCLFQWYFFGSFLCLCVTPLHSSPSQILPPLSAFCSSDFFPNVSLSFPIWFLSPSTNVYFLALILLSTFPFQVLLCLISVFIFFILSLPFSIQIGLKYCRKSCS